MRKESKVSPVYIGIDPGITGAVGLLIAGQRPTFLSAFHMPVQVKRSGRREVDGLSLFSLLVSALEKYPKEQFPRRCVVEQVTAMPGQGVSSMFSLGDSYGTARTVASLFALTPCVTVAPVTWKKRMGVTKNKAYSLTIARQKFPDARAFLERKKDEARAEALLLALYAYQNADQLFC